MHWASLNWTDIMINLLRGTLKCDKDDDKDSWDWACLNGDVWKNLGKAVAKATPYLPGSFDRPPRNPAEKISSGYKAWEWLLFMVGMGPALLHGLIPDKYWRHFCRAVSFIRIFHQHTITRDQLLRAHKDAVEWVVDFEKLYYQRKVSRLHFVRQSIHIPTHLGPETIRVGPPAYYTQWPMERTIGSLGEQLRQPSNPYSNLSERALFCAQLNALSAMFPELNDQKLKHIPRGARDLGGGFVLLRRRDELPHWISGKEADALREYLGAEGDVRVKRWARLRLPNGQIARSSWKEKSKALEKVRMSRNVKLRRDGKTDLAEVEFYFRTRDGRTLALAALYPSLDQQLWTESYQTVWSCKKPETFIVFPVQDILSVVAMVPHQYRGEERFFLVEKPGMDIISFSAPAENDEEDADDAG
ncbi:hypothetical protein C8F01DRAFT_1002515 [Mycena amicta]|nr:hypothetical protein C8F01DRAFT_1002515 [Mycena amicta]